MDAVFGQANFRSEIIWNATYVLIDMPGATARSTTRFAFTLSLTNFSGIQLFHVHHEILTM